MNAQQFYPTPIVVAEKLATKIQNPEGIILEPSAGTGDLIEGMVKTYKYTHHCKKENFDCVELNPDRAAVLRGKGYRVVWNDFLTFRPITPYETIVMNPPFNNGAQHLLHALSILAQGGELACILNAETIRNPFSRERKLLLSELENYNADIEFVDAAFENAKVSSDVEIAIVHVKKPAADKHCITFEGFKKSAVEERIHSQNALVRGGEIDALIDNYKAEVMAALRLYDEIQNYNSVASTGLDYDAGKVFEIKINFSHYEIGERNSIVRKINLNYWRRLLYSKELSRLLTSRSQYAYSSLLNEMSAYEFNDYNILQMKYNLCKRLFDDLETAIMKIWEEFTSRFSWTEYSQNIHYYNGWKTNKAFKVNRKVIIPLNAFDDYTGEFRPLKGYTACEVTLADIEKVMNYLDSGRTDDDNMALKLSAAEFAGKNRKIDTKYFLVDLYKKGTCHLTFKNLDLLKKFNLFCGRKKNWLPPSYGKKPYHDLDDEERAIADSFEGAESYQDTFINQNFYLASLSNSEIPLLTEGFSTGES